MDLAINPILFVPISFTRCTHLKPVSKQEELSSRPTTPQLVMSKVEHFTTEMFNCLLCNLDEAYRNNSLWMANCKCRNSTVILWCACENFERAIVRLLLSLQLYRDLLLEYNTCRHWLQVLQAASYLSIETEGAHKYPIIRGSHRQLVPIIIYRLRFSKPIQIKMITKIRPSVFFCTPGVPRLSSFYFISWI